MTLEKNTEKVLLDGHGKIFQIKIPATTAFSSDIREIIWSLIENNSLFSKKWKYRMQLVTDELINNAIEHWSSPWDDVLISVKIYENYNIEITVEDSWTWTNKMDAETLMKITMESRDAMIKDPASNKTIRWRWLSMIVFSWSDSFNYLNNDHWWLTAKIIKYFTPECWNTSDEIIKNELKYSKAIKLQESFF